MGRWFFAALLAGVLAGGCAGSREWAYERDGLRYGVTDGVFRGRWWSYSERGSSFLAGRFYEEAVRDFQVAIKGRATDSWRARTYGLHFVEYFPNRELGVAYYHLDQLDEAERCLLRSLSQIDTDRAHYYLKLVRKQQIARGLLEDRETPQITVSVPKIIAGTQWVRVALEARDDVGVAGVRVNGRTLPQRGAPPVLALETEVTLEEGENTVTVAVRDLAGKESTETRQILVDMTGPTIGLFAPVDDLATADPVIRIRGAAVDRSGVAALRINDRTLHRDAAQARVEFDQEMPLRPGENLFVVSAADTAGNETRSAVHVFHGAPDTAEARHWLLRQKHPDGVRVAHVGGAMMSLFAAVEDTGPQIRLKSPDPARPYRHNRTLCVAGEVITPDRVAALTINGEPFEDLVGAPRESFNKRIPISDADADRLPIDIHAEDMSGAQVTEHFEVEVRPVTLASRESRMPVAVLAFAGQGVDPTLGELLRTTTEAELVAQDRFRLLDRMRLQDVLTEQQLADALGDPAEAIRLGRITPAHVFLVADVFPRDQQGVEVKARVISTETSEITATLDAFIDNRENREAMAQGCASLASQLAALYPRLSGEILSVRGEDMLLNWTRDDGVREGSYCIVVQEEPPWVNETTGEVIEPGEFVEVGRGRITGVLQNGSRARAVDRKEEGIRFESGMPAVTM